MASWLHCCVQIASISIYMYGNRAPTTLLTPIRIRVQVYFGIVVHPCHSFVNERKKKLIATRRLIYRRWLGRAFFATLAVTTSRHSVNQPNVARRKCIYSFIRLVRTSKHHQPWLVKSILFRLFSCFSSPSSEDLCLSEKQNKKYLVAIR